MTRITIDGTSYEVVENLGYQHSAGHYAKVVKVGDSEKVAVKIRGGRRWRFWTAEDRVRPLREAMRNTRR